MKTKTNFFLLFKRAIKLGIANFWRNKFVSIAAILVLAAIIFIFNLIITVKFISAQAIQNLSQKVDAIVYLKDDTSFYDAQSFFDAISQIPGVKAAKFTSKDEALNIISKSHPETAEFIKKANLENPLPASISIVTETPEIQKTVQEFIQNSNYKNLVQDGSVGENSDDGLLSKVNQNLLSISTFVRQIIFWMVLIFILGGTLVVFNSIELAIFNRRHEIHIMKLVGAPLVFIRLPFIIEGLIYTLLAIALSLGLFSIISSGISLDTKTLWEYYSMIGFGKIILGEILIAGLLGIISSFVAVEQYLKNKPY